MFKRFIKKKKFHHDHRYEKVHLRFELCVQRSKVSGELHIFFILNCPSISLWGVTEWGWEIKESCVLAVGLHDVGLCWVFFVCLSCHSIALLFCTAILRHKVRGVNEKLSGQHSRPKIRFLRGREQPSRARSSFSYSMRCLSGSNLAFTSLLETRIKVSAD